MSNNPSPRVKRLGRVLYRLAWVLGVAELGIMSRAAEWLEYEQVGTLGFLYFLGLLGGVLIAPRLPMRSSTLLGLSVLVAALPIVGIGVLLSGALGIAWTFSTICALWAVSGMGAGMLDNAHNAQSVNFSTRGRTNSVAMLGVRHLGTLSASAITAVAVSNGIGVGWHYIALGAVLVLPILGVRHVPNLSHATGDDSRGNRSPSVLVVLGLFLSAAVLPISASWAYINPVMIDELQAPGLWGTSALSAFVLAQAIACFVYFKRSLKHDASRLVRGGIVLAGIGAAALVLVVAHLVPAESAHIVAYAGFVLLGWGIAPLPMVIFQRANALPLRMKVTTRLSLISAQQCVLVALGNLALGRAAQAWGGENAFAATCGLCVALMLASFRLIAPRAPRD